MKSATPSMLRRHAAKSLSKSASNWPRAAMVLTATGILLCAGSPAQAAPLERVTVSEHLLVVPQEKALTVAADAKVSFSRDTVVESKAAPEPVEVIAAAVPVEAPVAQPAAVANQPAPIQAAAPLPAAAQAEPVQQAPLAPVPAPIASPAPAPAPASSPTGSGSAVASAALAQLGVSQDCTALATNALKAVGINYHGWPAGYKSLGRTVSAAEAQPGDLIYYDNAGAGVPHIAVYIGGGQAVHGGWNGGTTAIGPAVFGSGATFIAIGH